MIADALTDVLTKWIANPSGLTGGAALVLFVLGIMTGRIHTDAEFQRMKAERDALRASQDTYLEEYRNREREERRELAVRQRALGDS